MLATVAGLAGADAGEAAERGDDAQSMGEGDAGESAVELDGSGDGFGLEVWRGLALGSDGQRGPLRAADIGAPRGGAAGSAGFDRVPDLVEVAAGERRREETVRGECVGQDLLDRHLVEGVPVVVDELVERAATDWQ